MGNNISPNFEQDIRRSIRDAFAIDPLITDKKLIEILDKRYNRTFTWKYISKLKKKVLIEATPNLDRQLVQDRLRKTRELIRIGQENLLKIAYGQAEPGRPIPSNNDRVSAWKAIAQLEKLQLEVEAELGIYHKGPDPTNPDAFRFAPVPEEIRAEWMVTLRMWKMPTELMRKIEPSRVIEAKTVNVPTKVSVEAPAIVGPATQAHGIIPDPEFRIS